MNISEANKAAKSGRAVVVFHHGHQEYIKCMVDYLFYDTDSQKTFAVCEMYNGIRFFTYPESIVGYVRNIKD